ncbi:hypothetical protein BJ508DRAFT_304829 [Ascobolus immersus RN42]|uniref:Uncharacterized protein n=1 Tax=Ascobolus immersus RN42 TaxID=1160509 RepID=A0A3N4ICZ9_ASCIM|nr:hypothetical protein BJ508DRAFT_304829 [Ascobolus immersus RN42]
MSATRLFRLPMMMESDCSLQFFNIFDGIQMAKGTATIMTARLVRDRDNTNHSTDIHMPPRRLLQHANHGLPGFGNFLTLHFRWKLRILHLISDEYRDFSTTHRNGHVSQRKSQTGMTDRVVPQVHVVLYRNPRYDLTYRRIIRSRKHFRPILRIFASKGNILEDPLPVPTLNLSPRTQVSTHINPQPYERDYCDRTCKEHARCMTDTGTSIQTLRSPGIRKALYGGAVDRYKYISQALVGPEVVVGIASRVGALGTRRDRRLRAFASTVPTPTRLGSANPTVCNKQRGSLDDAHVAGGSVVVYTVELEAHGA